MIGLLKGYYGYKNFGDEVLLLGIIPYIFTHYPIDHLYIEAADVDWLQQWLDRHEHYLGNKRSALTVIEKHTAGLYRWDELFLGGGEVLTDGRPFPYNGRNYLFRYRSTIIKGQYHLFGGIGTPNSWTSRLLRGFLLSHAKSVVVREKRSYEVAAKYGKKSLPVLYHDFAEDVLPQTIAQLDPLPSSVKEQSKALLNVNPYIWSQESKQQLVMFAEKYTAATYFPAEIGVDDTFFAELQKSIPGLTMYDWTKDDIPSICVYIRYHSGVMAARLHVLWMAKLLHIPFTPLVYQEKISTFLAQCSDELVSP